jgi:hypothetical protein
MSRVRHGSAGSQSRRDEIGLCQLFLTRSGIASNLDMNIDAIGALRGQCNGDCDKLLVLFRNGAIS